MREYDCFHKLLDHSRCARVFLMQNHPLMILGTRTYLDSQPDFSVTGSARFPRDAFEQLEKHPADVLVFELSIIGPFDFLCLEKLRSAAPSTPILAYSYHEEVIFARRALQAGASGYLMKEAPPAMLAEALREILQGRIYLTRRVKQRIKREVSTHSRTATDGDLNGSFVNSLSNRELQIFQLLGDGLSREKIRETLNLTPHTLNTTFYRMRKKLSLENVNELAHCAFHWAYYEGDFS